MLDVNGGRNLDVSGLISIRQFRNRKNLKDMVYQMLKQRILNGEYKPGDQLLIEKLVQQLRISRTPIKEAINQLQAEGIVDIFSQRGTFITSLSAEDIQDTFDVRKALELSALEKLIDNLDGKDEVELKKWLREPDGKQAADRRSLKLYDLNFHKYIIGASKNKELIRVYDTLFTKIQMVLTHPSQTEQIKLWTNEHAAIIKNILKKDVVKAKEALCKHLDQACNRLIQAQEQE
jgi:DNA-binding GntR family transcriptional regulator